jgi:hypothetical protein
MNSGFRKYLTFYLLVQVLYLTQIYPYAHLHAHTDDDGLHLHFVTHLVAQPGSADESIPIPHRHSHHQDHSDEVDDCAQPVETLFPTGIELAGTTSLDPCDMHGTHHLFSSSFQPRTQVISFAIPARSILIDSSFEDDDSQPPLASLTDDRGPPDEIIATLRCPRPPPVLA